MRAQNRPGLVTSPISLVALCW